MEPQLHLLLADDDKDDRFFFNKVLKQLTIPVELTTVDDGVQLMDFLSDHIGDLPDALFLDLNMPRKNGSECLAEIKLNQKLKNLPVIIYSTSLPDDTADLLYKNGAYYYIRKTYLLDLKKILEYILPLLLEKNFKRPPRDKFLLKLVSAQS